MNASSEPRQIVVGYDGSPQARDALAIGLALARATGDTLTLAGAYGPVALMSHNELGERGAEVLDHLDRAATSLPPDLPFAVEGTPIPGSSAAAALQNFAEATHPRALVLGSCHRGPVGRVLLGSVAERLLNGAPCPVVVAPLGLAQQEPIELRTVCVGFDGRTGGWAALQRAAQIAAAAGAHLRLVMAVPPLVGTPTMPTIPAEAQTARQSRAEIELERAVESVAERLEAEPRLVRGAPQTVLSEQAGESVDLLVTGSRGYGPVRRILLGSVSSHLMRSAPCPVMVVPRRADFEPSGEGMAAEDEFVGSG